MTERRRILLMAAIMVAACVVAVGACMFVLYRAGLQKDRARLRVTAKSQARLIEAVARFDAKQSGDFPGGPTAATLAQIVDAHARFRGFGETGEFALARREGGEIVFLLRHRHGRVDSRDPIAFDSELAEPMRRALQGQSGSVIGLDYRGQTVLAGYEPVAELDWGIVAKIDLAEIRAPFIHAGVTAAGAALLIIVVGTALFFRVSHPLIARLESYSRDLERTVEERTRELEEAQEELVRKGKLAVLGELSGGVGHELRNPLGVIANAVYYLKTVQPTADDKVKEYLEMIAAEVRNAEGIVTDLLDFSRSREPERGEVPVASVVDQVLARRPPPDGVEVEARVDAELPPALADERHLGQVLRNLVHNAYQAMPDGGNLCISAEKNGDAAVCIRVADTGAGIPAETIDKIFEPLFTTKARGIGLGLSVTRKLVEVNRGKITVESHAGEGTAFAVVLPTGKAP